MAGAEGMAKGIAKARRIYRLLNVPAKEFAPVSHKIADETVASMSELEPRGIYFADKLKDIPTLLAPGVKTKDTKEAVRLIKKHFSPGSTVSSKVVRAELQPGARVLEVTSPEEWHKVITEFRSAGSSRDSDWLGDVEEPLSNRFTRWLRKNYDAVRFPDTAANQPGITQTVLLNPGKATGKIRQGGKLVTKMLGVAAAGAGAGAATSALSPDEAEAQPESTSSALEALRSYSGASGDVLPEQAPLSISPEATTGGVPEDVKNAFMGSEQKAEEQSRTHLPANINLESPEHLNLEDANMNQMVNHSMNVLQGFSQPGQPSIIVPGGAIPQELRDYYAQQTGKELPETFPEDEGSMANFLAECGIDMAAFGVASGLVTWGLGAAGATSATGVGLPAGVVIAAGTIVGALAVAGLHKLRGKPHNLMIETIPGITVPEPWRLPAEAAEWFGLGLVGGGVIRRTKVGARLLSRLGKPAVSGMERGTTVVAKPMRTLGELVWDNTIAPVGKIPFLKGKTIAETFQPGVERLEKTAPRIAQTIRRSAVLKSLSSDVADQLGKESRTLLPAERYQLYKTLKGGEPLKDASPRVKELYSKYTSRIKEANINTLYSEAFNKQLGKLATKKLSIAAQEVSGPSVKSALKLMTEGLKPGDSPRTIQRAMASFIDHPKVSDEAKQFAIQLYDLPANTIEAASDAARRVSTDYLSMQLMKTPGTISETLKPGYVVSKFGRFKGMYINKDVELELESLKRIPEISQGLYNKWFLGPWKTSKVIMRPATHMRNLMSNMLLNDIGGLPFYRADVYGRAIQGMRNESKLWKEFASQTGYKVSTFGKQELHHIEGALKYDAKMTDRLYNVFDKIVSPARKLYSAEEAWFKFAKYMHNIEKGMTKADAALDAVKWTLNYGEITPAIATTRKFFMPFFTWQAKVLPLVAEAAVKHPVRVGKWLAAGMTFHQYAIEKVGLDDDEWEYIHSMLPEYMQKGMYLMMPWRDERDRLQLLNMTYIIPGLGDINEYYQRGLPEGLVGYNPIVTMASAIASKKKYSGAPLYNEWDPPGTKWAKTTGYIYQTLMPAPFPGNIDWNMLWNATQETEGAATPQQAVASFFGFKTTPIDPTALAIRKEKIQNIFQREIEREMQKELAASTSYEKTQRILRKYQAIKEKQQIP